LVRHPDTPASQANPPSPSFCVANASLTPHSGLVANPRTPTQVVPPCSGVLAVSQLTSLLPLSQSCNQKGLASINKIMVFDNFLEKDELQTAIHKIKNTRWTFGHKSRHEVISGTPFWSSSINDDSYFTGYLLNIICKTVHKNLKLKRVYANGHTFGQDGTYHQDSTDENTYTFVLYLHEIDISDVELAGGHLYFKFPHLQYNICYEPILNRGIFFPSNYFHKACSFSRYIMELRTSVAWKLTEIK